jgi:hypothetical protein
MQLRSRSAVGRPFGTSLVGSAGWETVTERAIPPTARERAAFDAATTGGPRDFVRVCQELDRQPEQMLDEFEAAPWRWLTYFSPGDPVTDEVRHRPIQPAMQARLDAVREYIEAPWWRRVFGHREASQEVTGRSYTRTRLPGR